MSVQGATVGEPPRQFLDGSRLWGDDLDAAGLEAWYADEANGYFQVATEYYKNIDEAGAGDYEYRVINDFHAFGLIKTRRFPTCVAIGCANGQDVEDLAASVDRFIGIEPAEAWWRAEIGGKPATFIRPDPSGDIALADASADLFVSMGVLHHIPNVSHVVAEAARVLAPGGWFVLREPASSMGAWWRPRPGLTARERGLPPEWLKQTLREKGFRIVRARHCMTTPLWAAASKIGIKHPLSNRLYVMLDWAVSQVLSLNARYYRPRLIDKFAPGSVFLIAEKI